MATIVWAQNKVPVQKGDEVIRKDIAYAVYSMSIAPNGYATVTITPDEGGHPSTWLPSDLGMMVEN